MDKVCGSKNWREAESGTNVDDGPAEVEDYAGLGPARLEVRIRVQGGNNEPGDD